MPKEFNFISILLDLTDFTLLMFGLVIVYVLPDNHNAIAIRVAICQHQVTNVNKRTQSQGSTSVKILRTKIDDFFRLISLKNKRGII